MSRKQRPVVEERDGAFVFEHDGGFLAARDDPAEKALGHTRHHDTAIGCRRSAVKVACDAPNGAPCYDGLELPLREERTMGPLGWSETVFIFFLALLLFGPKKLPELGRTIGKAMTEFRRASTELKSTFDREIKTLEQETELKELTEVTNQYQYDNYNYDYSSYESTAHYEGSEGSEHYGSTDST